MSGRGVTAGRLNWAAGTLGETFTCGVGTLIICPAWPAGETAISAVAMAVAVAKVRVMAFSSVARGRPDARPFTRLVATGREEVQSPQAAAAVARARRLA